MSMNIIFKIIHWNFSKPYYELNVDGQTHLKRVKIGELRTIFNEMEKLARLRFKGELTHKKKVVKA